MNNDNLYSILGINNFASKDEIKKSYRKLALKYHPDKNKSLHASELFNKITIAYDILSNDDSKKKYDSLNNNQHNNLIEFITNVVKSMVNPDNINKIVNILCDNDTNLINELNDLDIPNYDKFKDKIEERLQNKLDLNYINEIMQKILYSNQLDKSIIKETDLSIFMAPHEEIKEKKYQLISSEFNEYSNNVISYSNSNPYTNSNEMNIFGEIKTTLDEIYMGCVKEINVKRQIIKDSKVIFNSFKYIVPIINDSVIFENQGDEYLDNENNIKAGNLIVDIRCKKHKYFKRVNDFDIFVSLPLTLFELFNGFNKRFDYFNKDSISLIMKKGFKNIESNKKINKYSKFDGNKIIITLSDLGIINDDNKTRGNLIIYLVLIKKDNFNELLKKNFE